MEYRVGTLLLDVVFLAVNDDDALLQLLYALAPDVVDAGVCRWGGLRLCGLCDAGVVDGGDILIGDALELEGADAEARLSQEVDDDAQ